ncbi:hypothetical protein [Niabella sp.]|uniref:hypothetical protein n=1 Tax=Niabella sp. TaxID=1962976 RepID=UPI0026156C00|nr:hypothetical protein [Niabella sp.]
MQQPQFNNNAAGKKALTITKKHTKDVLSKVQQTFNRLVKRIEKLQVELKTTTEALDKKLNYYTEQVYPVSKELTQLRNTLLKQLYAIYKDKSLQLSNWRKYLKTLLKAQLNEYLAEEEHPDDEIKSIFKAVFNKSYDAALKREMDEYFEDMKSDIESMFEAAGFSMNLDELHSGMTPEEMLAKTAEIEETLYRQAEEKEKPTGKKTKKQLEREEKERQAEAAKSKNISSIYKQLAKIFHPDLEPDPGLKLQKEELMKQLTTAYENNDLHTLLRLELQWVQNEEAADNRLTDEKLSVYNEIMKEQVLNLENEIDDLYEHPRYASLRQFVHLPWQLKQLRLEPELKQLKEIKKSIEHTLTDLSDPKMTLPVVQQLIEDFLSSDDEPDFSELADLLGQYMSTGNSARRKRK